MGKSFFEASIEQSTRKTILSGYSIIDMLSRVRAHGINIETRMFQAKEISEKIIMQWSIYVDENKDVSVIQNIFGDFQSFSQGKGDSLHIGDFETVFKDIENIVNNLEQINLSQADSYLRNILEFLNESYSIIENNTGEESLTMEIDYERIVARKTCIQHEISNTSLGESLIHILKLIYDYYTQFWRILEMYGDLYNDVSIFLDIFINRNISLFIVPIVTESNQEDIITGNKMISLDNGLSYNISTKSFHYMGHLPYSITGGDIYNQREKFMQILCEKRRQDIATYQELIDATGKRSSNEVQTVYKNIRDGLESQFGIRKSISSFCTNIPRVGYKLKMR